MEELLYDFRHVSGLIRNKTFRDRVDCQIFVLDITKIILMQFNRLERGRTLGDTLRIVGDPLYRVVMSSGGSHHSLVYPFSIQNDDGCLAVVTRLTGMHINLTMLSQMAEYYLAGSANDYEHGDDGISDDTLEVLKELDRYEDGYIRFDDDPERENGKLHPRYHYDVFYTNMAKIKIGLSECVTVDKFMDFLNGSTDCHFIG